MKHAAGLVYVNGVSDVASPRRVTNIKENPQEPIICLDATARKGCRIWGKAKVLASGGPFDVMAEEFTWRNMEVVQVVNVAVEEVATFWPRSSPGK